MEEENGLENSKKLSRRELFRNITDTLKLSNDILYSESSEKTNSEEEPLTDKYSRRDVLGAMATGLVASGLFLKTPIKIIEEAYSALFSAKNEDEHDNSMQNVHKVHNTHKELEDVINEEIANISPDTPGFSNIVKHMQENAIDYVGTGLFLEGLYRLKQDKSIPDRSYASIAGTLGTKFLFSDDYVKKHIVKEVEEGFLEALPFILGTTVLASNFSYNVMNVVEDRENPNIEELLDMLVKYPLAVSPVITTVGSSTSVRDLTEYFVDAVVKNSNLDGDDTAGGVKSNENISHIKNRDIKSTVKNITEYAMNIPGEALSFNLIKSPEKFEDKEQLRRHITGHIQSYVSNLSGMLLFGDPPFLAMLQKYGLDGLLYQCRTMLLPELASAYRFKSNMVNILNSVGYDIGTQQNEDLDMLDNIMGQGKEMLSYLKRTRDGIFSSDSIQAFGTFGYEFNKSVEHVLKESGIREGKTIPTIPIKEAIRKNMGIKTGMTHELEDILTIFPYQVMGIPHMETVLKDVMNVVDYVIPVSSDEHALLYGGKTAVKDLISYSLIAGFSMVADNYVAAKLGLNIMPEDRPELAISAAIVGGTLAPPANMANMCLFNSGKYSYDDAMQEIKYRFNDVLFNYAMMEVIPMLRQVPVLGKLYDNTDILNHMSNAVNGSH